MPTCYYKLVRYRETISSKVIILILPSSSKITLSNVVWQHAYLLCKHEYLMLYANLGLWSVYKNHSTPLLFGRFSNYFRFRSGNFPFRAWGGTLSPIEMAQNRPVRSRCDWCAWTRTALSPQILKWKTGVKDRRVSLLMRTPSVETFSSEYDKKVNNKVNMTRTTMYGSLIREPTSFMPQLSYTCNTTLSSERGKLETWRPGR